MLKYAMASAAFLAAAVAGAADVRIVPEDGIVLNPANPNRGYADLVIHSIAVGTEPAETLVIDNLVIELRSGDTVLLSETLAGSQVARETRDLMSAPVPAFVTGQLLNRHGLAGLFGRPAEAGRSAELQPSQALVSSSHYFAVRGPVDSVRVVLHAHRPDGVPVTAERTVPVAAYRSPIQYRAPLRGTWLMQAIPTLSSHHRFNPSTEFAVDFFKVDAEGRLFNGDPLIAGSFYGYGADVLAAADGDVVRVIDGESQNRAAMIRRTDESPQAAGQRIGAYNMERMARDFERAAAGNLVILRHERNGTVEYSSYGHLQRGIPVRVGQHVTQGQLIGHVGDTGDSAAVHLHFQVNAAADPFASKSLPVQFAQLRPVGGNSELGRFVLAE